MKERQFISENIKRAQLEEFLNNKFARAGYSHCEIQRTPLSMRVTVFAQKPGMVIGRGGKIIDEMAVILKEKFGFENPQLDVKEILNPNLDAGIVAKQIANSIDRGFNYKRSSIMTIDRVMKSGATGIAIRVGGKLGGDKSRFEKFSAGYLKFSGNTAETLVNTAYSRAQVKLGTIGIQVRIMIEKPKELMILEQIDKSIKHDIAEGKAAEEQIKEMEKIEEKNEESTEEKKEEVPVEKKEEVPVEKKEDAPVEKKEEVKEESPVEEVIEEVKEDVVGAVEDVKDVVEKVAEAIKEKIEEAVEKKE